MVLTPEEQASIEERFEVLEERNKRLERLIRSGKAFTNNPLVLATDLDDLGSVKTYLEFELQDADPAGTPLPDTARLYAKDLRSQTRPFWQSDSGDVYILGRPEVLIVKASDESVTSSTTLQNDDELLFAVGASETWVFTICMFITAATASDLKMDITVPSGASVSWMQARDLGGTSGFPVFNAHEAGGSGAVEFDAEAKRGTMIFGTLANSTNAGNVQLRWAQNTSGGTATTVHARSWLSATQLS